MKLSWSHAFCLSKPSSWRSFKKYIFPPDPLLLSKSRLLPPSPPIIAASLFAYSLIRFVLTSSPPSIEAINAVSPHLILDTQAVRSPRGPLSRTDMLSVFLRTLIVSLRCFHAASTTPSGQDVSLWFVGCVNTSSIQAFTPTSVRDLDPTSCYEGWVGAATSIQESECKKRKEKEKWKSLTRYQILM